MGTSQSGSSCLWVQPSHRPCSRTPRSTPDVKIAHPPADDPLEMKLVACPSCHAQYDADQSAADSIVCRCGTTFTAKAPASRDVAVTRCGSCGALLSGAGTTCSYCRAEVVR